MDSQTHIEHTLGLAALIQALVRELSRALRRRQPLSKYPFEMLDENKWLAARHGLEGELVDLPQLRARSRLRALARRLIDRMRDHCQDLGSRRRARGGRGPARARQRRRATGRRLRGEPRPPGGDGRDRRGHRRLVAQSGAFAAPLQSVREHRRPGPVRHLQELRVRGEPVHHRVPVLRQPAAQARAEARPRRAGRGERRRRPPTPSLPRLRRARSPGSAPSRARTRRSRSSCAGLAGCLLWRTALVSFTRSSLWASHGSHLVAAARRAVHLRNTGLRVRHARRDRALRVAARAPARSARRSSVCSRRGDRRIAAASIGVSRVLDRRLGANGAALALIVAWAIPDLLALRAGEEIEGDLLGTR